MNKLPMYILMATFMGLGGYIPVIFHQSALSGWSVLGTMIGGIIGIIVYKKLRDEGYIE